MSACHVHRCHNGRMWFSIYRRCGCCMRGTPATDAVSTDMSRCHHRKFSTRNITSDRLHGDIFMPQNNTRHCFDLNIFIDAFCSSAKRRICFVRILYRPCRAWNLLNCCQYLTVIYLKFSGAYPSNF